MSSEISYISKISLPNGSSYPFKDRSILYGTCATAASTVAKLVLLSDDSISSTIVSSSTVTAGTFLAVSFTYSNTASSPTITLYDSTGTTILLAAKSLKRYGTTATGTTEETSWRAGAVVLLLYDGTNWVEVSSIDDGGSDTSAWVEDETFCIESDLENGDNTAY